MRRWSALLPLNVLLVSVGLLLAAFSIPNDIKNLTIHTIEANLGVQPADTFLRDLHPDLKADYILANPPFNVSDWSGQLLENDPRWRFGKPPNGNANYARDKITGNHISQFLNRGS